MIGMCELCRIDPIYIILHRIKNQIVEEKESIRTEHPIPHFQQNDLCVLVCARVYTCISISFEPAKYMYTFLFL